MPYLSDDSITAQPTATTSPETSTGGILDSIWGAANIGLGLWGTYNGIKNANQVARAQANQRSVTDVARPGAGAPGTIAGIPKSYVVAAVVAAAALGALALFMRRK